MKEKNVVLVEFTGREAQTGRVFDTTIEEEAKKSGLWKDGAVFRPVPVIVGNRELLPGLDEALREMEEGQQKTIRLPPEKAFGERRKELIVIVPLHEFHKRQVRPVPGLIVDLNGQYGRVQTVSGGRVRVDMNNDLAGKEVEYTIRIVREVKDVKEKAELLTEKFFPLKEKAKVTMEGNKLKITFPRGTLKQLTPLMPVFEKTIKEAVPEIKKVEAADAGEERAGKTENLENE